MNTYKLNSLEDIVGFENTHTLYPLPSVKLLNAEDSKIVIESLERLKIPLYGFDAFVRYEEGVFQPSLEHSMDYDWDKFKDIKNRYVHALSGIELNSELLYELVYEK